MKVLVADKFPADGLEELRAAGCEVVLNPDLSGPDAHRGRGGDGRRGARRALDGGEGRDARGGPTRSRRAGRGRLQHDRHEEGLGARDLRLELPRQELDRRRRADDGADPGPRPPDPGRGRGPSGGRLEQGQVRQGPRPLRADPGDPRHGKHRARGGPARAGIRPSGAGVEPLADRPRPPRSWVSPSARHPSRP